MNFEKWLNSRERNKDESYMWNNKKKSIWRKHLTHSIHLTSQHPYQVSVEKQDKQVINPCELINIIVKRTKRGSQRRSEVDYKFV